VTSAVIVLALAGCSDTGSPPSPAAERGRQVYLAQCTACHNPDPAQAGPLGPPLKGTAREVVEAKVVTGAYPPGYVPKRPTSLMPPQPALAPEILALAEFLK
jgi:mono/diheme cytochrome c family protein